MCGPRWRSTMASKAAWHSSELLSYAHVSSVMAGPVLNPTMVFCMRSRHAAVGVMYLKAVFFTWRAPKLKCNAWRVGMCLPRPFMASSLAAQ